MARKKQELMTEADWEKQLAASAENQKAMESAGSGNKIGKRNGKFSYQGANIGTEMLCIVLGFTYENAYYGSPYDPDNPAIPTCFAISDEEGGLEPHENSPEAQSEECASCWANEWESSGSGRGKACKNGRRLAVLEFGDGVDPDTADVAQINLAPTEIKNWKKYFVDLNSRYGRPPYGVVTRMFFEDAGGGRDIVNFEMEELIKAKQGAVIMKRLEEAEELLFKPYEQIEQDATPRRGTKKKVGKKKVSKKASKKKAPRKSRLG